MNITPDYLAPGALEAYAPGQLHAPGQLLLSINQDQNLTEASCQAAKLNCLTQPQQLLKKVHTTFALTNPWAKVLDNVLAIYCLYFIYKDSS